MIFGQLFGGVSHYLSFVILLRFGQPRGQLYRVVAVALDKLPNAAHAEVLEIILIRTSYGGLQI